MLKPPFPGSGEVSSSATDFGVSLFSTWWPKEVPNAADSHRLDFQVLALCEQGRLSAGAELPGSGEAPPFSPLSTSIGVEGVGRMGPSLDDGRGRALP